MKRKLYLIGGIGFVLVVLGVLTGWVFVPLILKTKVADTIAIREGSEAYERWKNLPVTMLFKVYVFEVLNPDGITKYGEKPRVKERGPFIYRETREKYILKMTEKEDTALYYPKLKYEFADDLSAESEETEVTVVNLPALVFAQIEESLPGLRWALHIFNDVIHRMWPGDPIFVKVKVKDLLFGGIKMMCQWERGETVIEKLKWKTMCFAYDYIHPEKTVLIDDGEPGLNTFSIFKYKKTQLDGPYEVKLGIREPEKIGEIMQWKGVNDMGKMWGGGRCSKVMGTDATVFRPFLNDVDNLTIFHSDICRAVGLKFEKTTEFKGVPARRYVTGRSFLDGVLDYPENYCFCPRSVKGLTTMGGCLKSGLLDLSSCQGAPVFLSHPHLLMSDPSYQESVDGLAPNLSLHQTFVDLEPNTGYPVRGAIRAQMNVFLKNIPQVDCMKNYKNWVLPVLWFDEGVELTDSLVEEVKNRLLVLLSIADIAVWVMIGFGVGMVVVALLLLIVKTKKNEYV